MTVDEVMKELKSLGSESIKKVMLKHGSKEPFYGVKIEDLKKIQKRVKVDHNLALALYDTGIADAMYLAGLIADDAKMTKKDLQKWLKNASSTMVSEYTVPWVAAGSPHGWDVALEWIDSKDEAVISAGWQTLSGIVSVKDDDDLDIPALKKLLERVKKTIHKAPNRAKYTMNGFVIAIGSYVKWLTDDAIKTAEAIGPVSVDMGDTACKVPAAAEYIAKVQARGAIGKKRKTPKC
jgi:3-methyladenine DNA glycosylase AlkD